MIDIHPTVLIITLNISGLYKSIKIHTVRMDEESKPNFILSTRNPS